jgi:hypothetical protein
MAGTPNESADYNLYCSLPSQPGQPASQLSVVDNFQSEYANLQTSINTAVDLLKDRKILDPEIQIQPDQIVSEKEDAQRLAACAEAEQAGQSQQSLPPVCGSDIAFAPVETEYFQRKLKEATIQSAVPGTQLMLAAPFIQPFLQENRISVPAGALQVFETIQTPDGPIEPGAYETSVWYANGVFYAVALTGITTDNKLVTDQQLYAVPSESINASNSSPNQPPVQASALIIWGGYCILFECG